ncbi:MAG: potassium channel family protein [Sandaracinaceae bacterium]
MRSRAQFEVYRGRLLFAGLLLVLVLLVANGGYHVLGGGRWGVEEVIYFTIITLSTVGFAETLPGMEDVAYARVWTLFMILTGSGTLVYFVSTLTAFIVETDIQGVLRRNRMQKRIEQLSGHFIVCGVGATGMHVVEELLNTHHRFVAIDQDLERLEGFAERFGQAQFLYVHGDATEDECLLQAGIDRAAGIIAALTNDRDNVFITLTAYQLERERADKGAFRIVAKAVEASARPKLRAAGAHRVVSPSQIGGMRMASEMVRPSVVEFLDLMLRDPKKNLRIEEVDIPASSGLVGARLRDTNLRSATRVLVIAVKYPDENRYEYNPGPDLVLEAGSILIVLAEAAEMLKLRDGVKSGTIRAT